MSASAVSMPYRSGSNRWARARSGSTYVGKLLSNTPSFADVNESFQPEQLVAIRERHGLADSRAAAQWMIDNRGTADAFGYKAGFSVLIAASRIGFLSETLERTRFIRLVRRDKVAQAISLLRAELGGKLHSVVPGEAKAISAEDYDAEKIAFNIAHVTRNERWFSEILDRLGKPAQTCIYEDICKDPGGFVASVCAQMDLPVPADFDAGVDLKILRDDISAQWAQRFRKERPELA
jgi:LPS sulfotransferase NodH